jgi:CRISPR-associated protein (TIGR02584 family)
MSDQEPRKVFLAVSGMSPQIITETLYALIQEKHWIPDEVHLITTEQGKQNAVLQLLEGERHFQRLLKDYQVNQPVLFSEQNIAVIQDANGQVLADLRTPQDNETAADTICTVIRELTSDADTELHVSLAGGRKTMGFYAGYALSLFGRPQDRLSHVLVSEGYESLRDFFYPTPTTRVIYDRDGKSLDASKAQVWLAEIPFVRLRGGLSQSLLNGQHGFSETVALARKATEKAHLQLFPTCGEYRMNGEPGKLRVRSF